MGYPNPTQIPLKEDVTFRGICVYVPNEPEYVRALLGSLAGLGQWVNWERDDQQSASRSAELWRLANDKTLESWSEPCGCDEMNCDDIREIIREELENMTITITNTNNCGCGCGCGGSGSTMPYEPPPPGIPYPPMVPVDPDVDEPSPDDVTNPDYLQFSCNMAHYMYYLIRQSLLMALAAHRSSLTFAFTLIEEALGFSVRPGGADKANLNYWEYVLLGGYLDENEQNDLIRQLDLNYEILVCALSSSLSSTQRRENFLNAITQLPITEKQRRYLRFSMSAIDFGEWFAAKNWEVVQQILPDSYQDRDCPCQPAATDPVWVMVASSGYNGVTTLARTLDNAQSIAGVASVFKASQYGAYMFEMQLENIDGLASGDITIDFSPGVPNPSWELSFHKTSTLTSYTIELPSQGQYTVVTSGRPFPPADIDLIVLKRIDEIYTAQAPRAFTFSFSADWELLS